MYFVAETSGLCFRVGETKNGKSCCNNLQQGNPEKIKACLKRVQDRNAAKNHLKTVMKAVYKERNAHTPTRQVDGDLWFVVDPNKLGGMGGAQWLFMQIAE